MNETFKIIIIIIMRASLYNRSDNYWYTSFGYEKTKKNPVKGKENC